jgi:hypothetical protein
MSIAAMWSRYLFIFGSSFLDDFQFAGQCEL